jgi:hypothetical protein
MTAEPLSEREIEELQWLLSESFIGGKLIQHPRYPQQVFPDGSSDAFCTVQVSNVECWDKRAGLIAAAINALPRLIAASRPTDRGEPVADDLLRRAQELAERAPLGHWSNTKDGETLWLMAEALRDRPTETTGYAQDLSEPRPAMATGHDLKDHPKWEGDLRERVAGEVRKILQHGWACGRERGGKGTDEQCRADADVHVENYTARLIAMLASTPSPEGE